MTRTIDEDIFEAAVDGWADDTAEAFSMQGRARTPAAFLGWADGLDLDEEARSFVNQLGPDESAAILRVAVRAAMAEAWSYYTNQAESAIEAQTEAMRDRREES